MRIYLSSSWKNRDRVRDMAERLRAEGHEVYDFTDSRCREGIPEIPPESFPENFDPEKMLYREYLHTQPVWKQSVDRNFEALKWCDVAVLMLPAGNDAHADAYYALGRGRLLAVVGQSRAGERTPTHLKADVMLDHDHEIPSWLNSVARSLHKKSPPHFENFCECPPEGHMNNCPQQQTRPSTSGDHQMIQQKMEAFLKEAKAKRDVVDKALGDNNSARHALEKMWSFFVEALEWEAGVAKAAVETLDKSMLKDRLPDMRETKLVYFQFLNDSNWSQGVVFRWRFEGGEPEEVILPAPLFVTVVRNLQKKNFPNMPELKERP